jgi:uncharacterized protein YbaP (TraB family)
MRRSRFVPVVLTLGLLAPAARAADAPAPVPEAEPKPAPAPAAESTKTKPLPFLWVVEGPTRIYLFGTIHLPDERITLPPAVKDAHAAADAVWGELSLEDLASPKTAIGMMLPAGKSLTDVVPKATMDRLTA